jgi:hypothetical protein
VLKQKTVNELVDDDSGAGYGSVSQEHVVRLQSIIAGLLAKNERLRGIIATNSNLTNQVDLTHHTIEID